MCKGYVVFIGELTLQVLVLALQCLQMIQRFLIGVFHLEKLSAERTSLFQGSLKLCLALLILLLPLCQNLNNIIS